MEHKLLYDQIEKIIDANTKSDGWCYIASLGTILLNQGIKFEKNVLSLSEFLKQNPNFEVQGNTLVRVKNQSVISTHYPIVHQEESEYNGPCLSRFAYINYTELFSSMDRIIRKEHWGHNEESALNAKKRHLKSQFTATYHEEKLLISEHYAAFQSGFYTSWSEPIIVVLEKKNRKFFFHSICVPGSSEAKVVQSEFGKLPLKPNFGLPNETYLDVQKLNLDMVDFNHIAHRVSRFPKDFLLSTKPNGFNVVEMSNASEEQQKAYGQRFFDMLQQDVTARNNFFDKLKGAISRSIDLVSESLQEAVIGYNFKRNELVHLLPVSLSSDRVDIALVLTHGINGNYSAPTILSLEQSRSAARSIGRITNSWLR